MEREEILKLCNNHPDTIVAHIEQQDARINQQDARIIQLEARIVELEARLNKNSRNSSRPPSTDAYSRPKSPRERGERSPGGQKGHTGKTLEMVDNPDHIVNHTAPVCQGCGGSLAQVTPDTVECRQVCDFPKPAIEYTEHRVEHKTCPECGLRNHG